MDLPAAINAYWDSNAALPSLKFQYAPAKYNPPIAILNPKGFSRERLNGNFKIDTHRYEFTVIKTDAADAFETGMAALDFMNLFSPAGLIVINGEPDSFATPVETGQANMWQFKFTIDIEIQPS